MRRKELSPIKVHYDIDPRTDLRRIYGHDVSELEVEQVLQRPTEDHFGDEDPALLSAPLLPKGH